MKRSYMDERILREANLLISEGMTIRDLAKIIGVSKTTVHLDITKRLQWIDRSLYIKCLAILEKNKDERHIRGGQATKEKWERYRSM